LNIYQHRCACPDLWRGRTLV